MKFFVHHGDYIVQEVSGIRELVGSDVNLLHRLMKNHITANTGWNAYILFTSQALQHMGVHPEGMHEQFETYEHLGNVHTLSINLLERYQAMIEASHIVVTPEEADYTFSYDFDAPPAILWGWLTDVEKKNLLSEGETVFTPQSRPSGRSGPGATNHCAHGKNLQGSLVETVLDWRPFDYFTVETVDGNMVMRLTYKLEPISGGSKTRLHIHMIMISPSLPRIIRRPMLKLVGNKLMLSNAEAIARHIAQETEVDLGDIMIEANA